MGREARSPTREAMEDERERTASASVFIVAGEASGDWAGAMLARALRRLRPDLEWQDPDSKDRW